MDESLLRRIACGNKNAMGECISVHGTLVWNVARRLSRTVADAEDATQEIFLDIWRSAGNYDASRGSEKIFIAMIARRRAIDRLRKSNNEPPMDCLESIERTVANVAAGTTAEDFVEAAQAIAALATLRIDHRQVLELNLLRGLTHAQIAARLHLPLGTVKCFMRRGLQRVRELMSKDSTHSHTPRKN